VKTAKNIGRIKVTVKEELEEAGSVVPSTGEVDLLTGDVVALTAEVDRSGGSCSNGRKFFPTIEINGDFVPKTGNNG